MTGLVVSYQILALCGILAVLPVITNSADMVPGEVMDIVPADW